MWGGLGTWNIVFLTSLKKTKALQKNNFSSSDFILRACLGCFQSTQKVAHRDSNFRLSKMKSATLTITLQELCFQGILLSGYLCFLWLQRAGFSMGCSCGKTIFQALLFFPHCSPETQTSPALQKSIFQALKNNFFACLLSNLPTPPCYLV